jgi:hypothetical protein
MLKVLFTCPCPDPDELLRVLLSYLFMIYFSAEVNKIKNSHLRKAQFLALNKIQLGNLQTFHHLL